MYVNEDIEDPTEHAFPQDSSIVCYFRYYGDSESKTKGLLVNVIK